MRTQLGGEIDAFLRGGGIVLAASERTRRALLAAYHRARRAEGHAAWNTPAIYDWPSFVRNQSEQRRADDRLVLNPMQEQVLWARAIEEQTPAAALLREPLRRLADMAMEAHALLYAYAPHLLDARRRGSWRQDAEAFSRWLAAFDAACRDGALVSASRLTLDLTPLLEGDSTARPPLLLAGFDRILPVQRRLLDAWGEWLQPAGNAPTENRHFYAAIDDKAELAACALWCRQRIEQSPAARILVITQDAARRRGELERAFLHHSAANSNVRFEFSLGVPLAHIPLARSAQLLLHWLDGDLDERELDWLFSTSYPVASTRESAGLQAAMREMRRNGRQRMSWSLDAFLRQAPVRSESIAAWSARLTKARQMLSRARERKLTPLDWAAIVPQLLETAGWPGYRTPESIEFQAARRFHQTVDLCGSLGFDGRTATWRDFLSCLTDALFETLFAPQSEDAPILIAGPAESAGLTADAIWFLGAHEDAWPARGSLHPLLPPEVQREFAMPHASPQIDFDLACAMTERLAASSSVICFSFARQIEGVDARPSRLIERFAGAAVSLPAELAPQPPAPPLAAPFDDWSSVAFPLPEIRGGAAVLTAQSQCPFKAFATARLGAQPWDPAEPGLTPIQRGHLLHAVLHAVWGGPPAGIRSLDELLQIGDLPAFVSQHVRTAMAEQLPNDLRELMPARYLALEERRLTRIVTEWLQYEATRVAFSIADTEISTTAQIANLTLNLRLDRVDHLANGSMLVIDYKTGDVSPKAWGLPRPNDVQLPLYAGFGLPDDQLLGGLVFAKMRAGDLCFTGCVGDAPATLGAIRNSTSLKRSPLSAELLISWRETIEQLARDFIAGKADVDPRDPPQTCKDCGLYTLCRIHEAGVLSVEDESEEAADA